MKKRKVLLSISTSLMLLALSTGPVLAAAVPGGTLNPLTIPKYATPLVIPPVMKRYMGRIPIPMISRCGSFSSRFCRPVLPATTVWSYGPAADPVPAGAAPDAASQFNYPAYTIETTAGTPVKVRWINGLVDANGNPLPHLLGKVVDQTLHWANPGKAECMSMDPTAPPSTGPDCMTMDPAPYLGAVPMVPHVHGAHVDPHSDGYPQAWWLPAGVDPALYNLTGSLFSDSSGVDPTTGANVNPGNLGYADYSYRNDQPATTLWFHDHTLGMTRLNVYAGPAGFWLIRGGQFDGAVTGQGKKKVPAVLPGPAPVAGQTVTELNDPDPTIGVARPSIREIPIVIQDRSFNADGSLFYPSNRAFFEGLNAAGGDVNYPLPTGELQIPFVPDSDISPIWNPESFFNVMVVNGRSWPTIEVAPAQYRLRLLNGCGARFLNLEMNKLSKINPAMVAGSLPFFQIGGDQGFLPQVVRISRGEATPLPGNGKIPLPVKTNKSQALLLALAERADVIVDFRGLANGTVIRMINTAPDAPFGGFPDIPADPATTGQVMEFVVNTALNGASPSDPAGATPATDPYSLVLNAEPANATPVAVKRSLSLNEEESATLCVTVDDSDNVVEATGEVPPRVTRRAYGPQGRFAGNLRFLHRHRHTSAVGRPHDRAADPGRHGTVGDL